MAISIDVSYTTMTIKGVPVGNIAVVPSTI